MKTMNDNSELSVPYLEYEQMEMKLKRRIRRAKRDHIELQRQLFMCNLDAEILLKQLEYSESMISYLRRQIALLNQRLYELEKER